MKKSVALICEDGYRFKYPQVPDLAETLSREGFEVTVIGPLDPVSLEWNAGRGFEAVMIDKSHLTGFRGNLFFAWKAAWAARKADHVVPCTTVALAPALLAKLMFGRSFSFYALECQIPGDEGAGSYAGLQYLLRYTTNVVAATGSQRSKLMTRVFGLRRRAQVIDNAALLRSTSTTTATGPATSIVEATASINPDGAKRIVVLNGGLSPLNCLGLVLDVLPRLPDNLVVAFFGPIDAPIKDRFLAAVASSRNAIYLGLIPGNRAQLIEYMRGATFGVVFKSRGKSFNFNDRLYTPNKIYDYLAADVIPVVSRNIPLRTFVREGIAIELAEYTAASALVTFQVMSALTHDEVAAYRSRVSAAFATKYNFEACSRPFVDSIKASMRSDAA